MILKSLVDLDSKPSRKERLRKKNPQRHAHLIRIATPIMATDGYNAANIGRMVELAGVGVGTLYSYFDDKDDLFLSCVDSAAAKDLRVKRERVDASAPALEMLRSVIRVDCELAEIDPSGQRLLRSVFYGINSHLPISEAAQKMYLGSIDLVERALEKGIAEGVFELHGETRLVAMLFNGMMETFHVLGHLFDDRDPVASDPRLAQKAMEILCRGILSERARREK